MSNKFLKFFNKEGDNLNFSYSEIDDRYEGTILFHENSSDTFKTVGIYTLEKVPSFEFESPGSLGLNKFQLFNEWGFDFYSGKGGTHSIELIEPINNDANFYSKWIWGSSFDIYYPIGTIIRFNDPFLEFTNKLQTYVVVATRKNAIMIISSLDNASFESAYYTIYSDPSSYTGKTITAVNAIGIYKYIDGDYNDNLSSWNEPSFYEKLYKRKKLNIVNTQDNDGVVTVNEEEITDITFFEYYANNTITEDIIIELVSKTDLPKIYDGSLNITYQAATWSTPEVNKLVFSGEVPDILKPGREFKIIGSSLNTNFLTVAYIPTFLGNTQQTYYATQSQVIWNNKIYECVTAYTQSYAVQLTEAITPDNQSYWTNNISYILVDQQVYPEFLSTCQLYLTTDRLYFSYGYTHSGSVTLACAAQKYVDDFKLFNIELYYENKQLKADLTYPSKYAEVNFYQGIVNATASVGGVIGTYERLIQVSENLNKELNYDISSNKSVSIVFTDLDEYGIKIKIDKQVFEEEINWVPSSSSPDMERTIDKTLRSWLNRNYINLEKLGIVATLHYVGSYVSPFFNSIKLQTEYPNVDMTIDEVLVGTTADYYIEHSRVLFHDIGSYLSILINGESFDQATTYLTGTWSKYPDIPTTLENWVTNYSDYLLEYGIIVSNINNLLKFNVKELDNGFDYSIRVGKSSLPGIDDYVITQKLKGNLGALITSNEIVLNPATYSFEEIGFATGMALSINNTNHVWTNTEYNIQFLDPDIINLSYQGPFWGTIDDSCVVSPFLSISFDTGFGQTACVVPPGPTGASAGPFNPLQFSSAFSVWYNPNTYTMNIYDLQYYSGTDNMVDISYVQLSDTIYALGDKLIAIDAYLGEYMESIDLSGNTQSKCLRFNTVNNYVYCVSDQIIYVVDPLINTVISSWTYSNIIKDVEMNSLNGDIYISFENAAEIEIREYDNTLYDVIDSTTDLFPSGITSIGEMVFNTYEGDMYVQAFGTSDYVIRINSDRTIQTTYGIVGLTGSIFYEPINESIYTFGQTTLWKIDNGITASITDILTQPFTDILFNNLTGHIDLSDSTTSFKGLDLTTDAVSFNKSVGNYGYLALNQYDGCVYLSSKSMDSIIVLNSINGSVLHNEALSAGTDRIVYNPERNSVWAIQPSLKSIVEIMVELNTVVTSTSTDYDIAEDNRYGTLDPYYVPHASIWLKSKEYLRRPRENFTYEEQITYYWKWYSDNVPEFFMYDFSGLQLATGGSYAYTGPKPLTTVVLNKYPNQDVSKVSLPEYQQTIFDEVSYTLSYIDDEDDISVEPESLELFLGFRSDYEGGLRSILQLYRRENISVSYEATSTNDLDITLETENAYDSNKQGLIKINAISSDTFLGKGFKEGQLISIYIQDVTNSRKQYISNNNGVVVKIKNIFYKTLIVDFLNEVDFLFLENLVISDYPSTGNTTYCEMTITVIDQEIGRFMVYGQTEIEDIRFKTELGNVGKLVAPNEVFIFKEYDILEGGIDWVYLNKKRKEMLMMKHLIYPYIGAYKSIINAINFFGYNDLKLNEYYRNIDPKSENFLKLFKIEIPDIFDNSVDGWTESEFITNNFPNDNYEGTNLFNLTYDITDIDGNNIINYSIDEIIIKLQGLKYWLKRNIIPLTHKILDITGQAFVNNQTDIVHTSYDVRIFNISQNMTPISFKLNEAYLMPINSGSTVYNCVVDFYSIIDGVGADKDTSITPFNGVDIELPDYFDISIRTYKTYKEWAPFSTYDIGDKVIYYGKIYESQISDNSINNPLKYNNVPDWKQGGIYSETNLVEYRRDIFVNSSTISSTSSISPILDTQNWLKITEWKEIDYEPVQTIKEFRRIPTHTDSNPLLPFNFTIDANIDPFVVIEVTTDNGYGLTYRDRKNYEIRSTKDLTDEVTYIDEIGPFTPISPIN